MNELDNIWHPEKIKNYFNLATYYINKEDIL